MIHYKNKCYMKKNVNVSLLLQIIYMFNINYLNIIFILTFHHNSRNADNNDNNNNNDDDEMKFLY